MKVIVNVTSGIHHGRKFWLKPGQKIVVGGDESAEIALPNCKLSPTHFLLECSFQGCDLIPRVGETLCNGVPVQRHSLVSGDQIQAGELNFAVEIVGQAPRAAATIPAPKPVATGSPIAVQPASQSLPPSWDSVRSTDDWNVLKAVSLEEDDPSTKRVEQICAILDDSSSVFRLVEPDKRQDSGGLKRFFLAQHLDDADRKRISVSLDEIAQPLDEGADQITSGISGWVTQQEESVINKTLRLVGQGRGSEKDAACPASMLLNADPNRLAQLFSDWDKSVIDSLVEGFGLIWADCITTGEFYVLANTANAKKLLSS